jgi:hypothetical protein
MHARHHQPARMLQGRFTHLGDEPDHASLSPSPAGLLTPTCSIKGDISAMWSAPPSSADAHAVSLAGITASPAPWTK